MSELKGWLDQKLGQLPDDWIGAARWLLGMLGGYRARLGLLSALRTLTVLLGVASAAVNRGVIDAAVSHADGIWLAIGLFIVVQVSTSAVSIGLSWFSTMLGERLSNHLREELYRRLLGGRWDALTGHHSEQLLSRLTSDVSSISSGLTGTAVSLLAMVVQAVAAFALLIHYDASLALFVAVLTPVAVLTSAVLSIRLRMLQQKVQQAEADYRQRAQETIAHVEVVKAFGAESDEAEALSKLQGEHERLVAQRALLSAVANGVMSFTFVGAYLFAFLHGILGIMGGTVTYGTFVAFLSLVSQVQSSLASLGGILPRAASVMASVARVREVAAFEQEAPVRTDVPSGAPSPALGIEARDVSFSYGAGGAGGQGQAVLSGLSCSIAPGEVVALMGLSGAGKTTLVRLLLGLLEPTSGTLALTCDGVPQSCIEARPRVGYVPQGNTLFSGTIRENLQVGNADASDGEIERALADVSALDFVRSLPEGLGTRIGERALGLSEGQAQRISIARALLRRSGLLLLDEATSALDEATELSIMRSLRERTPRPTCVLITHRREVLPFCDRVLALRSGPDGGGCLVEESVPIS
ncbi:MAG TPA: ABC transporter ATP-binding protein/permease [Collinsella ihuae]|uniref:ABC transporter ATP-binding protein/permease n=1 Tax=Collinsella ihumii TaxID=1720204 RepID=A0A921LQV0_9ACTN|nr:ABC transporter ATP-binding protein/permease [Collinsella ihumii]